jgi:prevent-host-death family protein
MKTATVRDLRNRFPRVASWLAEGEPVEITKSGKPFARLLPAVPEKPRRFKMPDIMARLNRDFGDCVFSSKEIAKMRAAELEGEEG